MASSTTVVQIKGLQGPTIALAIDLNQTVADAKKLPEAHPFKDARWIFAGKELKDDRALHEYGVTKDKVIHAVPITSECLFQRLGRAMTTDAQLVEQAKALCMDPDKLQSHPFAGDVAELTRKVNDATTKAHSVIAVVYPKKHEQVPDVCADVDITDDELKYLSGSARRWSNIQSALDTISGPASALGEPFRSVVLQYCQKLTDAMDFLRQSKNPQIENTILKLISQSYGGVAQLLDTKPLSTLMTPAEAQLQQEMTKFQKIKEAFDKLDLNDEFGPEYQQRGKDLLNAYRDLFAACSARRDVLVTNATQHQDFAPLAKFQAEFTQKVVSLVKSLEQECIRCEADCIVLQNNRASVQVVHQRLTEEILQDIDVINDELASLEDQGRILQAMMQSLASSEVERVKSKRNAERKLHLAQQELKATDKARDVQDDAYTRRTGALAAKVADSMAYKSGLEEVSAGAAALHSGVQQIVDARQREHNIVQLDTSVQEYELFQDCYPLAFKELAGIERTHTEDKRKLREYDNQIELARSVCDRRTMARKAAKKRDIEQQLPLNEQEIAFYSDHVASLDARFPVIRDAIDQAATFLNTKAPAPSITDDDATIDVALAGGLRVHHGDAVLTVADPKVSLEAEMVQAELARLKDSISRKKQDRQKLSEDYQSLKEKHQSLTGFPALEES